MPPTALTLTPPDPEWLDRKDLPCRLNPSLMDAEHKDDVERARSVCAVCPVWRRCRDWTLSLPPGKDVSGVAGGLTVEERQKARRKIRRTRTEPPRACTRGTECVHGEVLQPATEFYRRPAYPSGRESQCKTCCQARNRANKAAKRAAAKQAAAVA